LALSFGELVAATKGSDNFLPSISIVTPSFNQAEFIERTLDSVLSQSYPNLEYIVVDGGSTDGSVEIIRKYEKHLAWWVSEPDRGQAHAINKGLMRARGDWVGWQNSDDVYLPGALQLAAQTMSAQPARGVVAGGLQMIDSSGRLLRELRYVTPTWRSMRAEGMVIANQSSWWRRELHRTVGQLEESLACAFDYDWFLRLLRHTKAAYIDTALGALRMHAVTKTVVMAPQHTREYQAVIERWGRPSTLERRYFQTRRALRTIINGHLGYVVRGARDRWRRRLDQVK
jgi:glycosyltransferase involved in cell wall biosynthesis